MAPSVSTGKKVETTITTLLNVRRGAAAIDFYIARVRRNHPVAASTPKTAASWPISP